ncbi:MAG: agmatinase [Ignavibacteriae bacterium]|nr:MAG: agmatinase [Ignavibacteriota bacterium]
MVKALDIKRNFLGIEKQYSAIETSKIVVLPVPYEHTVSYGGGTKNGPDAILNASHQVEYFDEETKREIYREHGIATLPPLAFVKKRDETALQIIYDTVFEMVERQKFVVTLGGEHSISSAAIAAHAKLYPDLSVLQFDAHSDLRPEYRGNKYSHASVMARVCEFLDPRRLVQVGIRAQCKEEAEFIRDHGINTFYAHDIRRGNYTKVLKYWDDFVVEKLSENVYISFDIDAFDPSIMPATGTPEPGGLFWDEVLQCLRKVGRKKHIVGFDLVELAPIKGLHHADVTAAKLVSKILNYAL